MPIFPRIGRPCTTLKDSSALLLLGTWASGWRASTEHTIVTAKNASARIALRTRRRIDEKAIKSPVYTFVGESFIEHRAADCIRALLEYAEGLEQRVRKLEQDVRELVYRNPPV